MAEYNTGSTGRIYIEDTGSWIDIYIDARNAATHVSAAGYSWSDPIGSGSSTFSWSNGSGKKLIQRLGPFGPGQGGRVTFTLNNTGTTGLGGPTTVHFDFGRTPPATVPGAPIPIGLDEITATSMRYRFSGTTDGGSPITGWQAQWAGTPDFAGAGTVASTGTTVATGMTPGALYYFRSRGGNALGWGPWSSVISARTLPGGRTKDAGAWGDVVPWEKAGGAWVRSLSHEKQGGSWAPVR